MECSAAPRGFRPQEHDKPDEAEELMRQALHIGPVPEVPGGNLAGSVRWESGTNSEGLVGGWIG